MDFYYEDNFMTESLMINELFEKDGTRWSNTQIINPMSGLNEILINPTLKSFNDQCIEFLAQANTNHRMPSASFVSTSFKIFFISKIIVN